MNSQILDHKLVPKVTVIVPVYNTELFVERAIISLMEQTLHDVQFIIIDDGSTDNSLAIIKKVLSRYPSRQELVTLISRENRGVAATRNQGLELASGAYVIHLDSDDWAEPNWLEKLYYKAIKDDADVVISDYRLIYTTKSIYINQKVDGTGLCCARNLLTGQLHGSMWNKLVRRSFIVDNNLTFLPNINYLEDFIFVMKVFLSTNSICHLDLPLVNYNQTNVSSITSSINTKKINEIINAISVIQNLIQENKSAYTFLSNELNDFKLRMKFTLIYDSRKQTPSFLWAINSESNFAIFKSTIPLYMKVILYFGSKGYIMVARFLIYFVYVLKRL
ncbi:glycosyltransferase family 2 protein [Shewanella chilikensis]|uniref:glycosyltransferase family 2 protein n=1 Tax=Shewanella chilikensis TaxID=558541 RepID=UPI001CF99C27|nr:glycosyltransferase family A protein [Shewanella chilikensis]